MKLDKERIITTIKGIDWAKATTTAATIYLAVKGRNLNFGSGEFMSKYMNQRYPAQSYADFLSKLFRSDISGYYRTAILDFVKQGGSKEYYRSLGAILDSNTSAYYKLEMVKKIVFEPMDIFAEEDDLK